MTNILINYQDISINHRYVNSNVMESVRKRVGSQIFKFYKILTKTKKMQPRDLAKIN